MKSMKIKALIGALMAMNGSIALAQDELSAPAQKPLEASIADANIILYGNVDIYLNAMKSSSGNSLTALEDGAFSRSRFGLKGEKVVEEGYTMKFDLEQGLDLLNGASADSTRMFDRQAWVGLASSIGEFRVGRQNSVEQSRSVYTDFTGENLGSVIKTFGQPARYDSDISYTAPRLYGVLVEAHYSLAGTTPNYATNQAVYQLAAEYLNGPYRIGYAGIVGKPPGTAAVSRNIVYHKYYANYDYGHGMVYLAGVHSNNNGTTGTGASLLDNGGAILGTTGSLVAGTSVEANVFYNIYQISADYNVTPKLRVGGLYGKIEDTTNNVKNANGWAVAGFYKLFKDTTAYLMFDALNNDPKAGFRPTGSAGLSPTFTLANDVNGRKITGTQLGMIYKF